MDEVLKKDNKRSTLRAFMAGSVTLWDSKRRRRLTGKAANAESFMKENPHIEPYNNQDGESADLAPNKAHGQPQ